MPVSASSGASMSSKSRSALAAPDCSRFAMEASWVIGWLKFWEYWMKAWTSPRVMEPLVILSPPMTAMMTKLRLEMTRMTG